MVGSRIAIDRPLLWHYSHFWGQQGPGIEPFSALRVGRFKLIFFYGQQRYELYDLATDLGETTNLVATHRTEAVRLSAMLRTALREAKAQMPIDPQTKRPVAVRPLR